MNIEPIKLKVDLESGPTEGWLQDGWYVPGYISVKDHDNVYCWLGPFSTKDGAARIVNNARHGVLHIGPPT